MVKSLLRVENHSLHFNFDKKSSTILDNINFNLNEGEILGIVGESGCGKSMLGNSILGLYPANMKDSDGKIYFKEQEILGLTEKERSEYRGKNISMIFQNPNTSLNPVIKIGKQLTDIIQQNLSVSKKEAREIALHWLAEVNLPEPKRVYNSYPHELSGGMKQRVVIAMSLSCKADLIIADEPTTALDVTTQKEILKLIKTLQKEHNVSIIIITHDIAVASYICDRILVMYAGRVAEIGPVNMVLENPAHPYTSGLLKCLPINGRKVAELHTIPGTVPSPIDFPKGCRFSTRCPYAKEECREKEPILKPITNERAISCYYPLQSKEGDPVEPV